MSTTFPATLDAAYPTRAIGDTAVVADHNDLGDAIIALETKVGIDASAVTTTLDYKVKNTSSIDPGHKHTIAGISGTLDAHVLLTANSITANEIAAATIGPTQIANRTRRIPLVIVSPAVSVDSHGGSGSDAHWHAADGADLVMLCAGIPVPADDTGGTWTIKVAWGTSVANNNIDIGITARYYRDSDANAAPLVLDVAAAGVAAPASANTIKVTSFSLTAPTGNAGSLIIGVNLPRSSGAATDTNTGQISVWGVWAEFTADS